MLPVSGLGLEDVELRRVSTSLLGLCRKAKSRLKESDIKLRPYARIG